MYLRKNSQVRLSGCVNRREFLRRATACTAGIAAVSHSAISSSFASANGALNARPKIKLILAYDNPVGPTWPNIGYDFASHLASFEKKLRSRCPQIDFLPEVVTKGTQETGQKILSENKDVDGYLYYLAGCLWGELSETITASGKPTIMVDHLFAGSGEFLTGYARARRAGHKVIPVSSSNFDDIVDAVKCLDCLVKLKHSNVLVVGREADAQIGAMYGSSVRKIEFDEINDAYNAVKSDDARNWADQWIRNAAKIVEPDSRDIEKSAAMYLAMLELMKLHSAQAITINCLGGVYSGKMVEAYPCLGFMQLDNDGLVGACEGDQRSTMTKLLMTYLVGRPGFISDPVIDTAKNQIIYAHCVGPTKVYGPESSSNPYDIRSHSEDRKGACNRSLMPIGEMTTTVEFCHHKKQVIFHQGVSVENVDDDKACRTKLAVEVKGDVYKLLNYWDEWGWHRVTFYGDLKRPVYNIASLLGFEVIEEA